MRPHQQLGRLAEAACHSDIPLLIVAVSLKLWMKSR